MIQFLLINVLVRQSLYFGKYVHTDLCGTMYGIYAYTVTQLRDLIGADDKLSADL